MGSLKLTENETDELLRDSSVLQALQLAERIQEIKGVPLEEEDLVAVAEATGVSVEYVRLVKTAKTNKENKNFLDAVRRQYLGLSPDIRRYVLSGVLAVATAFLMALGTRTDMLTTLALNSTYGVFQIIACLMGAAALYNAAVARNERVAAISGAIYGAAMFLMSAVFGLIFLLPKTMGPPPTIFPIAVAFAALGWGANVFVSKRRQKWGIKDPQENRQELLKQLVELQDRLTEGEEFVTFLSLDVVGSTKMKSGADPLAVEFTFNEYHGFVDQITRKHGGRVHSTAGDGITCAFDHPQKAFQAAKNIQTGLVELNTLRNKLSTPMVLRAGIQTGHVVAPNAGDITSVNFAGVIDSAAHLQKYCPPGGIAISDDAASMLAEGSIPPNGETIEVDGVKASVWRPKAALKLPKLPELPSQVRIPKPETGA